MEILRFEDAGKSAPNRKKSARGMIIVGLVATLFGVGTAFASTTIEINSGSSVDVGQGVSQVAACDNSISISPKYLLNTTTDDSNGHKGTNLANPKFDLGNITLSGVNEDTFTAVLPDQGCGKEILDLVIFKNPGASQNYVSYSCGDLGITSAILTDITDRNNPITGAVTCSGNTISIVVPNHPGQTNGSFSFPIKITGNTQDIGYFAITSHPNATPSPTPTA